MNRIRLYVQGVLLAMGPLGLAGIGMLVCAAAVFLGWILPVRMQTDTLQQQLAARGAQGAETRQGWPDSQAPLAEFDEFFPTADTSSRSQSIISAISC